MTRADAVTRIAGARPRRAQIAFDPARDRLRRPAEAAERAALVGLRGRLRDRAVEVRVRAVRGGADRADRGLAEARADDPRLHDDDVDAEARDLEAQRVGDRLDRVLGGVVEAAAREGEAAAHRGDVDDLAPAPASRIPGSTSWHIRTRPNTFVSNWARTRSIGTVSTAPDWL